MKQEKPISNRRALFVPACLTLALFICFAGRAASPILFLDDFEQFTNGADLTSAVYTPASGPGGASVMTSVQNGSPSMHATNFLGRTWALFDNSVATNENRYEGWLSAMPVNQPLQIAWKMWIQATNTGPGMFMISVPTRDPAANYNPPIAFMDTGIIAAQTNGPVTNRPGALLSIGKWSPRARTIMTNVLTLDYPNHTFAYSLNGQTLATLPLGPYFTNVVKAIDFNGFERAAGSAGNRFAIGDVTVTMTASSTNLASGSIAGQTIVFTTTEPHVATVPTLFGGQTFADLGTNTDYGIYLWSKVNGNGGQLTLTNLESDSDFEDVSTLRLTYTNVYSGTVTGVVAFAGGGSKSVLGTFTTGTQFSFDASPTNGAAPLTVAFTAPGLDGTSNPIRQWSWSFGDGSTSTNQNPTHTYTNIGTYSPSLMVTDEEGVAVPGYGPPIVATTSPFLVAPNTDGISVTITGYIGDGGALTIPGNINGLTVTGIGDDAFFNSSDLTSVTIPNSVTSIGDLAFFECSGLTNIVISDQVTNIGEDAFLDCSSLTTVTIPNSVMLIGEEAFGECSGLTNVVFGDHVAQIGDWAFDDCSRLSAVVIGDSVTNLGDGAFAGCGNLTTIAVSSGNPVYTNVNGVVFNVGLTTLVEFPAGKHEPAYVIPNSVTSIGNSAFENCSSPTNLVLGDSVTNIGDGAFEFCYPLASVSIPDSVTSIGSAPFVGCLGLTAITVSSGNPAYASIEGVLFNRSLTRLIQFPAGKFAPTYSIPSTVTSLEYFAFGYCSSLTNVVIPSGVTNIADNAFCGCLGLASVTIPNSVISLGGDVFFGCADLGEAVIGSNVTDIGANTFSFCSHLTRITIPNSVTGIGDGAFSDCSDLTNVVIGDSVTNLGFSAFGWCTNLTGIYFQGNAPSGDWAFNQYTAPTVYYRAGTTGWGTTFDGCPTALWAGAQPTLSAQFAAPNLILTWPAGLLLEATNLTGGGVWVTNSAAQSPYIVAPSGPQKFYRVKAN